ncbi:MAG: preprotein translocase subunit SecG [Bacteroidetes bacterium]|jgi:preprotein translocase subunit SecG|nr:MAG: preprotein translocase subunit SecG [Bacteroidota bacterium]
MSPFYIIAGILCVIAAILVILAVAIQNSKGGGINSMVGGGATQILGARRANDFIEKFTWWAAGSLMVLAFLANVLANVGTTEQKTLRMGSSIESQIVNDASSLPDANSLQAPAEAPAEGQ